MTSVSSSYGLLIVKAVPGPEGNGASPKLKEKTMKKIYTIMIWPLEALYHFRVRLFLTPGERAHLAIVAANKQRTKYTELIERFLILRARGNRHEYELTIVVPKAFLDAGDAAAASEIAYIVASKIIARHRKESHAKNNQ